MLVYPQAIMMSAAAQMTADYPEINSGNAIGAKCLWLAMPALFAKDSQEEEVTLFGGASINQDGLQVPNNSDSGAWWPCPNWTINAPFSIAWFGTPINYSWSAHLINLPGIANINSSELRLGRNGSTAFIRYRWEPSGVSDENGSNTGQGDHLTAGNPTQYVYTYDGGTSRFYRNGNLVYSRSLSRSVGIGQARHISICNRGPEDRRDGVQASNITLAAIFDDALTHSDVQSLGSNPNQLISVAQPPSVFYDYPAINSGHAIGSKCIWAVYPGQFEGKDSSDNGANLVNGATIDENGLHTPNDSNSLAWWPCPDLSQISSTNELSIAWFGDPVSWSSDPFAGGMLLNIPVPGDFGQAEIRFGRSGDSDRMAARWRPSVLGAVFSASSGQQIVVGQTAKYFLTYDGATARIYLNGTLIYQTNMSTLPDPQTATYLTVCNRGPGSGRNDGVMANNVTFVALFDRALSQAEIESLGSDPDQILL